MQFKLKDGTVLTTENPRTLTLKENLLINGVKVYEKSINSSLETIILATIVVSLISAFLYLTTKIQKVKGSL
ncbi:hypothetical protein PL321_17765 [Caloramator sp. mosi_1]|uniref:hypothetical protein n=1 Tax=Caloramator sp. mosi_1 TaxID=3023090 RepID=UPI002362F8A0|nr:hypothetical protein [Caloramator sp. mosi_1]WDC84098.1 hypothetical protein PL321_17765 [Caloramator sp. mosi_1]